MPVRNKKIEARHIKDLREQVRLTPEEFAEKLLVHRITVWRWEKGRSSPLRIHIRHMQTLWGYQFGVVMKEDK